MKLNSLNLATRAIQATPAKCLVFVGPGPQEVRNKGAQNFDAAGIEVARKSTHHPVLASKGQGD
jgi:hypothetical protein